jgi:TatD DNase family protein
MVLIDTHTHLYLPHFSNDIGQVIQNAISNNVIKMLLPNLDRSSLSPMLQLCKKFPNTCFPMLGLHPTSVDENYLDQLAYFESACINEKFVAIGETGMDAYWDTKFLSQQEKSFKAHLDLARKMDLPVVIHSRETMDSILSILKAYKENKVRGVLHAFPGTPEQALEAVSMGFKIGIGGVVTYKNSHLDKVIEAVGLENILLETDSPYLTPVPKRGKRNESANLLLIAAKIAEITALPLERVAGVTTLNAMKMFRL